MNLQKLKDNRWRIIFTLLLVAWILFIFSNSLRDAEESSKQSGAVVQLLRDLFGALGLPVAISEFVVRKMGHFCEYTALGVLLGAALRQYTPRMLRNIFVALFIGLAVPVCDEFIQAFSPGRGPMVQDVVLDFSGVLTGLTLTVICILLRDRRRNLRGQGAER